MGREKGRGGEKREGGRARGEGGGKRVYICCAQYQSNQSQLQCCEL